MAPDEMHNRLMNGIVLAFMAAPFFKNAGFAEEAEWRLAHMLELNRINENRINEMKAKPVADIIGAFRPDGWEYAERNRNLISHVVFRNSRFLDTINEIIIGPKCKVTENEIKLFLVSCGFFTNVENCTIKITKSGSSYM